MMLLDILFTLFLTHVGSLTTVKSNQRRFAPTPAHIAGIKCPHHRNKHPEFLAPVGPCLPILISQVQSVVLLPVAPAARSDPT
jgi:hypothetical protein